MKIRKISWDKQAINYFLDAIDFIREDSPGNADKIKNAVFEKIDELSERPEIHPPDKYKLNNTGSYRAFELNKFRISYLVKEDDIIIARVRSSKQIPLNY